MQVYDATREAGSGVTGRRGACGEQDRVYVHVATHLQFLTDMCKCDQCGFQMFAELKK